MADQEQIVLEADGSQVRREIDATNKAVNTYGETVIRVSDRSKNSIDRLTASVTRQAEVYGKTGLEKLIAQRDSLIARYGNEQRAVESITKSYNQMIDVEKRLIEQKRQEEEASRRLAEQRKREAEEAARQAAQQSTFSANYAMRGAKDIFEGRGTFAAAEGFNVLSGLKGAPLLIGGATAAFAGLMLAAKASASSLGDFGLEMENLHLRTGIATTDLNQFAFAAKVMGQDATIYERMMRGLSEALGENSTEGEKARAALQRLGVSVRDSMTGDLLPTTDVLLNISKALNTLPEGFQRDAAAMDLFKRAGIEALPVIENLQANFKRANDLHLGISDEDLHRWVDMHQHMAEAGAEWDHMALRFKEPLAAVWTITVKAASGAAEWITKQFLTSPLDHPATGFAAEAPLSVGNDADRDAKIAARKAADTYIRSMGTHLDLQDQLHEAEGNLSKLTKPQLGVSSLDEAKTYSAAQAKVNSLKEQIKYTNDLTEAAKRLQAFENAMDQRELSPTQKLSEQLNDFLQPHEGQPALTGNQRNSAVSATNAAIVREWDKQDDAQNKELAKLLVDSGKEDAKFWDTQWKSVTDDATARIKDDAKAAIDSIKEARASIRENDAVTIEQYSVQATHMGRMGAIASKRDGFGAEIEAVQEEFALKQQIRAVEAATIQQHAAAYDITKEMGRIDLENAKDRYAMEEQIAELRKKEFDEVEKTTEKLVNTLLTKPGSFSKELGSTIHAAILAPITHGISTMLAGAITPVIYGQDGKSGIAGALSGAFGSRGGDNPVKLSTDQNTTATMQNTAALYAVSGMLANGGAMAPGAPGMPGGPSVGTAGSAVANGYVNPSSSSFLSLGAFGATAALSGIVSYAQGDTQRQMNRNAMASVGASFGRGLEGTYNPATFPVRNQWAPGAVGIVGGLAAGVFAPSAPSAINPAAGPQPQSDFGLDGLKGLPQLPVIGGGGIHNPALAGMTSGLPGILGAAASGKLNSIGIMGNLKQIGTNLKGSIGFGSNVVHGTGGMTGAQIWSGGTLGQKALAVGESPVVGAIGMNLATQGLTGKYMGSAHGIAEGAAGGAMVGMQYGGPIGAAIGAAVGAGIGVGEMLTGTLSPQEKAIKYAKEIYGITISMQMAQQIASIAQSKYGGNVQVAVRDPEVRQMLQLYATGTGQGSKFPVSATTPMGISTTEMNGQLYQNTSYLNGQAYNYKSSLPVQGGATGTTLAGPTGPVILNVNGQSAADLLAGKIADTVTPGYVQDQFASSLSYSDGRVANSAQIQQPGLIVS